MHTAFTLLAAALAGPAMAYPGGYHQPQPNYSEVPEETYPTDYETELPTYTIPSQTYDTELPVYTPSTPVYPIPSSSSSDTNSYTTLSLPSSGPSYTPTYSPSPIPSDSVTPPGPTPSSYSPHYPSTTITDIYTTTETITETTLVPCSTATGSEGETTYYSSWYSTSTYTTTTCYPTTDIQTIYPPLPNPTSPPTCYGDNCPGYDNCPPQPVATVTVVVDGEGNSYPNNGEPCHHCQTVTYTDIYGGTKTIVIPEPTYEPPTLTQTTEPSTETPTSEYPTPPTDTGSSSYYPTPSSSVTPSSYIYPTPPQSTTLSTKTRDLPTYSILPISRYPVPENDD